MFAGRRQIFGLQKSFKILQNSSSPIEGWIPREGVKTVKSFKPVLFYSGIANPGHYDQSAVIKLLKKAALRGCSTALYNLGVLFENRGEKDKSKIFYDAARDGEKQTKQE